jgi:intracellular multiplication protein IcmL
MSAKNRHGATEAAVMRHETWKGSFDKMVYGVVAMAVLSTTAVGFAWWSNAQQPEPRYFATTEDGGILPLVAVNQPFLNDGQVTNFAVQAITRSLTLDFANWRRDLSESSEYFVRPDGWNNFLEAIEGSGTLDYVRNRRLVSTAVANGATIVRAGIDDTGKYSWTVQVPLTISYSSSSESSSDNVIAEILVSRVPTWQMSSGIGIRMVVVRPGR